MPLGNVLLSQDPAVQVPSALEGLTVVFGMGTRGSPPPSSPNGLLKVYSLKTECETFELLNRVPRGFRGDLDKPSTD